MKPILIAIFVVAATGIAILQHLKLTDLQAETARLEAGKTTSATKRTDRSLPATEIHTEASTEQIEFVREAMIEAIVSFHKRTARNDPERMKQLMLAVREFSGNDIARLIELLHGDPRLAGLAAGQGVDACREIFAEAAPFAWKDYLEAHRDLPEWQNLFDAAVRNCLREDGKRTLAMIEKETARGNPNVATTGIRSSVLLELATSDPDKMLAMAASPEFTADPDALAHLGGASASTIQDLSGHQHFLAALQRAQEKNPSPALTKIREDYLSNMAQQLSDWPPADAISLIESGLTPDEQFSTVAAPARVSDLPDPEKWIDWFLKIDPKEWAAWTQRKGTRDRHPLVSQIESRAIQDLQAPSEWLKKIPPGDLRDEATLSYAWMIADRDPDRAASYLGELPESKGKQNLVKKIGKAKR